MDNSKNDIELYHQFIEKAKVLVAEESDVLRAGIRSALIELGFKPEQIQACQTLEALKYNLEGLKPTVLVCESELVGIETTNTVEAYLKGDQREIVTMMIMPTEHDVTIASNNCDVKGGRLDAFLAKPFSPRQFSESLKLSVVKKINPSPYQKALRMGRERLFNQDFQSAKQALLSAVKLDTRPIQAYLLLGQLSEETSNFSVALEYFESALQMDQKNFGALLGMFRCQVKWKKFKDAYDTGQDLLNNFSSLGDNIIEMVEVCNELNKYHEIKDLFPYLVDLESKSVRERSRVSTILLEAGNGLVGNGDVKLANEFFSRVCNYSRDPNEACFEIVKIFVSHDLNQEAMSTLNVLKGEITGLLEFKRIKLELLLRTTSIRRVQEAATEMLSEGVVDERIFELAILANTKLHKLQEADRIFLRATHHYPESREKFENLKVPEKVEDFDFYATDSIALAS